MSTRVYPYERQDHPDEDWQTVPHDWAALGDTSSDNRLLIPRNPVSIKPLWRKAGGQIIHSKVNPSFTAVVLQVHTFIKCKYIFWLMALATADLLNGRWFGYESYDLPYDIIHNVCCRYLQLPLHHVASASLSPTFCRNVNLYVLGLPLDSARGSSSWMVSCCSVNARLLLWITESLIPPHFGNLILNLP